MRHHHIIDEAIHSKKLPSPPSRDHVITAINRAKRFKFTDEASRIAGRVAGSIPELILANHQFCIPPYRDLYVEFSINEFIKGIRDILPSTEAEAFDAANKDIDIMTGYLITPMDTSTHPDYRVWVIADTETYQGFFTTFGIAFNPIVPLRAHLLVDHHLNDWHRIIFMLGTGAHHIPSEEVRQSILTHWDMHMEYPQFEKASFTKSVLQSCMGEVRNIMTILLLLNMPKKIEYVAVGAARGIYRGKLRAYAAHTMVTIDLSEPKTFARYVIPHGGTHATPRRHEVKGHYYHKPGWAREHCTRPEGHDWPIAPYNLDDAWMEDFIPRWSCNVCKSRRTWVRDFERGDASKGFTTKDYDVEG